MRDRRTYIGSHDSVAILGLHPYMTALDVFAAKARGFVSGDRAEFMRGRIVEPGLIDEVVRQDGRALVERQVLLEDEVYPFLAGTADALCGTHLYEVTSTTTRSLHEWGEDGDPTGPRVYKWAQVQHFMALQQGRKIETAEIVLFVVDSGELRRYPVVPDAEFQAALIEASVDFWQSHVVLDVPPDIDENDIAERPERVDEALKHVYAADDDSDLRPTPELVKLAWDYDDAREDLKFAEARKTEVGARLKAALGHHARMHADGVRVSWTTRKGRVDTDWQAAFLDLSRRLNVPDEEVERIRSSYQDVKSGFRALTVRVDAEKRPTTEVDDGQP